MALLLRKSLGYRWGLGHGIAEVIMVIMQAGKLMYIGLFFCRKVFDEEPAAGIVLD